MESTDQALICPECRQGFQGVESLQKNLKLGSIINSYRATSSKYDAQPENRQNSNHHSAVKASQTRNECDIHCRPLEYFGSTDMSLLCSKCFTEGRHQHHDVLTFTLAEGEMRHALEVRSKVLREIAQASGGGARPA
ncbi:E3 ubiquitin-protein ligase TRIM13-like [Phycodurus eques]|uniref:E3 ubiquitin-protein ligase TRIM13-like n=1 Tax=Phycodurus eques TaxID=693459 RepID=UPI002ACDCA01|nr:E3 ubiquitin-protein ligase TRIM13-like [Phycodurus eques]